MLNRVCKYVCISFVIVCLDGVSAIPTESECNAVRSRVEELTSDDYAEFKAKKISDVELGEKLMEYVANEERPAARFLLLQDAYRHFILGKDFEKATEVYQLACDEDGSEYAVELSRPMKFKLSSFATSKNPIAKNLKDLIVADEKGLLRIRSLKSQLKKNPGDEKLCEQLGIEYAIGGFWDAALGAFAMCSGELKKVSEWERQAIKSSDYAADAVAKFWWKYADGFAKRNEAESVFKSHAAVWYRVALDEGAYTGNDVAIIEKRIASVEQIGDATPVSIGGLKPPKGGGPLVIVKGSAEGGDEWQYSSVEPEMGEEKWLSTRSMKWDAKLGQTGFDSLGWGGKPLDFVKRTDWSRNSSTLWLRKEFVLAFDPSRCSRILIRAAWDDNIKIWMNGVRVYSSGLRGGCMVDVECEVKNLRKGKNVLSVVVENTGGPGHFDLGMTATFGEANQGSGNGMRGKGKILRLLKDSAHNGERWQYSFEEPEMGMEKWVQSRFSKWSAKSKVLTRGDWDGHPNKIWLRKEIELAFEPREAIRLDFTAAWDDDLCVWLNGKKFLKKGYEGGHKNIYPCDRKLLKKGKNVISILVCNGLGNGFFDVGMEAEIKPEALKSIR